MSCPNITANTISINTSFLTMEHAKTPEKLINGLMHRENLPEDKGMLFSYSKPGNHSFWMKNTKIPLDMIFIDSNQTVVGTVQRAPPHSLESRKINADSCYVLETNAGFVSKHHIVAGMPVYFS
jgi:uncharacterized protein